MIIHQPETFTRDGYTIVWSRVELSQQRPNFPDYIWYRVPEEYSPFLSAQSDAFLAPALIAGMNFGEDIEVRGIISPQLAYSLEEYQFILQLLTPRFLQRVKISYDQIHGEAKSKGVAATFSGGVDSFFTIKSHLPENQSNPEYQITHALFIQNFDILNQNHDRYRALFSRYQKAMGELGIELVPIETNLVNTIIPRLEYRYFYGPVLAGCGMILDRLFKRFYISSSRDYYQMAIRASSSNPLSDRLLSTDSLDIVHFGANVRRVEKIEALADWKPAQEHLRVCGNTELGGHEINCSRCEKCIRTMIPLYAIGKMELFKTFSKPIRSNWDTLWWARKFDPSRDQYTPETFPFVKKHKPDLLFWIYPAAIVGYIRYLLLKLLPGTIKKWLRRFGFFLDKLKQENAFDNPVILDLIQSHDQSQRE
ncbi:MAG: hypothetical protein HZB50_08400 [Chloroflexi bacterium]|nr:hypothetical protein [Chloroflexota bacterium]